MMCGGGMERETETEREIEIEREREIERDRESKRDREREGRRERYFHENDTSMPVTLCVKTMAKDFMRHIYFFSKVGMFAVVLH